MEFYKPLTARAGELPAMGYWDMGTQDSPELYPYSATEFDGAIGFEVYVSNDYIVRRLVAKCKELTVFVPVPNGLNDPETYSNVVWELENNGLL